MDAISPQARARIRHFGVLERINTVWAFACLHVGDIPLLHSIAPPSLKTISDWQAQSLSVFAWSVSALGFWDVPLRDSISQESIKLSYLPDPDCLPQDIGRIAWSCASLTWLSVPLMQFLAASAIPISRAFLQQSLANAAWS